MALLRPFYAFQLQQIHWWIQIVSKCIRESQPFKNWPDASFSGKVQRNSLKGITFWKIPSKKATKNIQAEKALCSQTLSSLMSTTKHHPPFSSSVQRAWHPEGSWVARFLLSQNALQKKVLFIKRQIYIICAARHVFQTHILKKCNTLLSTNFSSAWDTAVQFRQSYRRDLMESSTPSRKYKQPLKMQHNHTTTAGWYLHIYI